MKKTILVILMFICGFEAHAINANDSWEKIRSNMNYSTREMTVAFQAGDATTFVSVFDVCILNDSQLMTIHPQTIWKVSYDGHTSRKISQGSDRLMVSRNTHSMQKIGNSTYVPFSRYVERSQSVEVFYKPVGSSQSASKMFTKKYIIPDC